MADRRRRSLKRPVKTRLKKKKIFLFCEGKNTEPQYFKAYERYVQSSVVELITETKRGVPKTLLELALERQAEISKRSYIRENGKNDQVWLAFDRDDHDDVPQVLSACEANGISVAFSNPCIEVWLILHSEDYDKDEHRKLTQKHCAKVCVGYDAKKGKVPDFSDLLQRVRDAEHRAIDMERRRYKDGSPAPLTTAYKLTMAIRS